MKRITCWIGLSIVGLILGPLVRTFAQENLSPTSSTKQEDVANLHPAFKYTGEQVKRAIEKGVEVAHKGKKFDAIIGKNRQNLHWTRGKGGKSHESFVWNYGVDGMAISFVAYRASSLYENNKIPEEYQQSGLHMKVLMFEVHLTSVPRPAQFIWEQNKDADAADVKVVKFVLSDDKDHNYTAEGGSTQGKDSSGSMNFSGITSVPTIGSISTGYFTSTFSQVSYIPWSKQAPYYQAKYIARFSLFDEDGQPRIKSDVKQITLHVITESGELSAIYKLSDAPNL